MLLRVHSSQIHSSPTIPPLSHLLARISLMRRRRSLITLPIHFTHLYLMFVRLYFAIRAHFALCFGICLYLQYAIFRLGIQESDLLILIRHPPGVSRPGSRLYVSQRPVRHYSFPDTCQRNSSTLITGLHHQFCHSRHT